MLDRLKFKINVFLTHVARRLPDKYLEYDIVEYFWNKEWL